MLEDIEQIEEKDFKFYPNFLRAIDILPEEKRAKACYEFCKFGITGILPEDESLAMFCIGVSASVQKFQGRGGAREGAGRKPNNQKIQKIQNNQKIQNIHNEQTETETETKTKTETKTEKPLKKLLLGEFNNVSLSLDEQLKLNELYKDKFDLAIEILSNYIASSGKKYKSHYAVLKRDNWVYEKVMSKQPKKPDVDKLIDMIKEA